MVYWIFEGLNLLQVENFKNQNVVLESAVLPPFRKYVTVVKEALSLVVNCVLYGTAGCFSR